MVSKISNKSIIFFYLPEGLDSFLLPLRLPHGVENCEDLLDLHREILNENYKSSLKYLHQALYTEPPLLVALLPFIQVSRF